MICDYVETQQFLLHWPSDFLIPSHTHTHTQTHTLSLSQIYIFPPPLHRSIVHQIVDRIRNWSQFDI